MTCAPSATFFLSVILKTIVDALHLTSTGNQFFRIADPGMSGSEFFYRIWIHVNNSDPGQAIGLYRKS